VLAVGDAVVVAVAAVGRAPRRRVVAVGAVRAGGAAAVAVAVVVDAVVEVAVGVGAVDGPVAVVVEAVGAEAGLDEPAGVRGRRVVVAGGADAGVVGAAARSGVGVQRAGGRVAVAVAVGVAHGGERGDLRRAVAGVTGAVEIGVGVREDAHAADGRIGAGR